MKKIPAIAFLLIISSILTAQVIPSSRKVDWTGAGYEGTIPNPSNIVNVKSYGATANGTTDDYSAIDSAIASLGGNSGVIYFPTGNYLIKSSLTIPANAIFRGSSSDSTFLKFDFTDSGTNCINISSAQSGTFTDIIDGFNKGSTQLTVISAASFTMGCYAEIRQDNGSWDTDPASWAVHSVGQIVKINTISGNILTIEKPLRLNFDTSLNLEIRKLEPITDVGIECLSIERVDSSLAGASSNIMFAYAANCWIKGVESHKSDGSHFNVSTSTNLEFTGNYIHHAFVYDGTGTRGYGITLSHHTGQCLIEDNILKHLRHAMMVKTGSNGNVFAYNYSIEPFRSELPSNLGGDISLHGHYPFANLFEGNIAQNIVIDHYWGPSGPFNTFFRNRAELYGIVMTTNSVQSDTQNFVGNEITDNFGQYVLKGSGHFEYGNNNQGLILPVGTSSLPDQSYYLTQAPDFWTTNDLWPSIGTPNTLGSKEIPAKKRYELGYDLTVCPYIQYTTYVNENIIDDAELKVNIFPNPFTNKITVEFSSEKYKPENFKIIDLYGRVVKEILNNDSQNNIIVIDFPEYFGKGFYFFQYQINGKIFIEKIIKF